MKIQSSYLKALKNEINIEREPFSDRGSRILIYKDRNQDFLKLKIAKRYPELQSSINLHRTRPAFIQKFAFIGQDQNPLPFRITTYPHLLQFSTPIGSFNISFQSTDTIAIGLPPGKMCGVQFQVHTFLNQEVRSKKKLVDVRNLTYSSTCPMTTYDEKISKTKRQIRLIANPKQDDTIHIQIRNHSKFNLVPEPFSLIHHRSEKTWHRWFSSVPNISGEFRTKYLLAWWVMANNLVDPGGLLGYEALMPSKAKYIGVWNWDACFHALGLRHQNPKLARDQLRLIMDHQQEDGMLPDAVYDEGVITWIDHPFPGKVTKPPVMAWAALKIHQDDPNQKFLEELYPSLVKWNQWWYSQRRGNGLPQYFHPYSSGLDDSPLWDHTFPITSPDLVTYLVLQMQSLATICEILQLPEKNRWEKQAKDLTDLLVRELYNPAHGFFIAKSKNEKIYQCTPFNFLPIWTNLLGMDIIQTLTSQLGKKDLFWDRYPLSTVSRDSSQYDPETMWRGPVWININYLFIEALRRIQKHQQADQLREATLHLVNNTPGIFEFYNPETGLPPKNAAPAFSWSSALFIDLLLQPN